MQIIHDLQSMGYIFTINNETLKYHFTGNIEPDPSKVTALMAELKKDKQSAIQYLRMAGQSNAINLIIHTPKRTFQMQEEHLAPEVEYQASSMGWTSAQLQDIETDHPGFENERNANEDVVKSIYNILLVRQKKVESLLDDVAIEDSKKQKWLPKYNKILDKLSRLLGQISSYTNDEAVNGFEVVVDKLTS